jgi:hypothetical protein
MPFRAVKVSFTSRGQRHTVEVDAETANEAACLALKAFSRRRWIDGPGRRSTLELEIDKPARMLIQLKVQDVIDWLYVKPPKSDAEKTRKERLKGLLADDRR